jgi:glycosyltransferase involved in cell wall biosynthesis
MKIVIDMQGAQTSGSRNRGIGRYTTSFVKALVRNAPSHEIVLLCNSRFPEGVEAVRQSFSGIVESIVVWDCNGPVSAGAAAGSAVKAAEISREAFISAMRPDVLVISSLIEGLGDDAVTSIKEFDQSILTAVIQYDLIPLIYRHTYLAAQVTENWYERKITYLKRADLLLAISEASRRDAIDLLGFLNTEVVNVSSAVDEHTFNLSYVSDEEKAEVERRMGIRGKFILYTGGIDHRKNVESLIVAYSKLSSALLEEYSLVIVCSINDYARETLMSVAARCGMQEDSVVLTGFVSEEDLVILYKSCELFVFPSLYEGFGLPILEAMRSGAVVIAADNSCIPEVVGFDDALFDASSEDALCKKLQFALSDLRFRESFRHFSAKHVEGFTWDKTASRALAAIEKAVATKGALAGSADRPARNYGPKLRLAYVSPMPPAQSGIADFSAEILPELARFYDVHVVVDQMTISDAWTRANAEVVQLEEFRKGTRDYDRIIYHFGNSHFHAHMFDLLRGRPGVVVLHDFFLSGVLAYTQYVASTGLRFSEELYASHGYRALLDLSGSRDIEDVMSRYPCNYSVISQALGIISHCEYAKTLASRYFGADIPNNWRVIPLARRATRLASRSTARARLGVSEDNIVICCFGHVGPTKLNARLLKVWHSLQKIGERQSTLVFVGQNHGGEYGRELVEAMRLAPEGRAIVTGWVDQQTYRDYLACADCAVQLRTNSRGETSAAVLDCLAAGLPTVVNKNGSMGELPDGVVLKIADDFSDPELREAIYRLISDEEMAAELADRGRRHVRGNHSPRAAAASYYDAVEEFYQSASSINYRMSKMISSRCDGIEQTHLVDLAVSTSKNFKPAAWQRQLLIEVSGGLPKNIERSLIRVLQVGCVNFRIEPVYADGVGNLRYARRLMLAKLSIEPEGYSDDVVDCYKDDVLFLSGAEGVSDCLLAEIEMRGVAVLSLDRFEGFLSSQTSTEGSGGAQYR